MKDLVLFYFFLMLITSSTTAQWNRSEFNEIQPFNNELSIGGGVHTTGWDVNISYGFIKHNSRTLQFTASFSEIKHIKEKEQTYETLSIIGGATKAFIYGKRNNFYIGKLGYSEKIYLSGKDDGGMFSLAWVYGGNVNFGLLKPYYLNLIYRNSGGQPTIRAEKFNEDNAQKFLTPQEVDGPAGPSYGWGELLIEPGFSLKSALLIDWGGNNSFMKDIEVGLNADFFFNDISLMIFNQNYPIFVNLYIHRHLGNRW